ncbi:MAG: trigger factor [Clostridia bacterium]|nr:trigger factor [Clostridia bacterium]
MTLISANKTEGCTAQIKFSISGEQFKAEVEKVYRKQVANITIPGFRKGKAPKSMIEKMYGKGFFYEEAINNLLPTEYPLALEESKLEAVSAPEIDIEEITDEKVVIIATIKVKPEVTVDEYKGIEVTRKVEEVKPAEVEAEIERVRQRNSRTVEITDRAAENGDMVVIDYSGSVDGVKFDGGTAEKQNLELGSGSFIPGFEEQVVGHAIGESFDITVTFPAEYHAPDLAGKEAVFAITLHEIKKVELPELDDEFARDVSEFDTLDEYKADIEAKIKSSKENQADQEVEGQLIDALIERLHADIPEEMFVTETENFVRDYDSRLRMNGLDMKTYFKYTGMTLETLREQLRPQAERQVKTRLALEKIAELEAVEVSAEEIEAEYTKLAEVYNLEAAKVKELVDEADIKKDLSVNKAVKIVKDAAKISE